MKGVKYILCPPGSSYAAGTTSLRQAVGKPIDLNGCTIFLCTEGTATVTLNLKRRKLRKGDFSMVSYDMSLILLHSSENFSAQFVSLPPKMTDDVFYKMSSASFWENMDTYPVIHLVQEQYKQVYHWFEQMEWIMGTVNDGYKEQMLHNNLYNLCMAIDSEMQRMGIGDSNMGKKNRSWELLNRFFILLNRHYAKCRDVDFYAKKLCITPDYLYKLCYRAVKTSPKDIIDNQVLMAIKTYLLNTSLSVKHIAAELNFEDPSYLCRFFRRMTNLSPIEFRNQTKFIEPDKLIKS